MEETEILVFILISFLESCKDEQLKLVSDPNFTTLVSIDEAKLLKNAMKNYKGFHSNTQLTNLILNYFNSK